MPIFSPKNIEVLNEAYYGKKKEFARIEELLEIIIQRCYNIRDGGKDIKINDSKELREIEALFEKAFGMGEMHLTFYTVSLIAGVGNFFPNAFTMSSMAAYFKDKRNGKEITDENLVCNVWVDTNLVTENELTTEELMGIILHELGHCYNASLFALLSKIPIFLRVEEEYFFELDITTPIISFLVVDILKAPSILNKIDHVINALIEKNKLFARIINNIELLIINFKGLKRLVTLSDRIRKPFHPYWLYKSLLPRNIFGYSDEKFADSFATAYGYGPGVVSAEHKFQQNKQSIVNNVAEKIPILNIGLDFVKACNQISILPVDPHPDSAIRMQSQINKLKRDLKDPNLDPKVKKELLANLKEMEDYVDTYVLGTEENLKNGKVFTMIYNHIMMKVFKGKADIREIFEIVYNHEM